MLLLAALLVFQDEAAETERRILLEAVRNLGSDDIEVREGASARILSLSLRCLPELEAQSRQARDPEVVLRLRGLQITSEWLPVLDGTLRDAQRFIPQLEDPRHPEHGRVVNEVLARLARRPGDEAAAALLKLLPFPGTRGFALNGLVRFPPRDASQIIPLLEDPATSAEAAAILVQSASPALVPELVRIFERGDVAAPYAAQVLERTGAGDSLERVLSAAERHPELRSWVIRICAKTKTPRSEEALIRFLQEAPDEDSARPILLGLAAVGSTRAIPALRKFFGEKSNGDSTERDRILLELRDPELGRDWLRRVRKNPVEFESSFARRIASLGGPSLRADVLDWLQEPGLKASVERHLLPILGAVGRREDGALLERRLADARLVVDAADGLDRLGDPTRAAALVTAWKTSARGSEIGFALLRLPEAALEDAVAEILADPHGYPDHLPITVRLAERVPTPRVRSSLLQGMMERDFLPWSVQGPALRILSKDALPPEAPLIERLRQQESPGARAAGALLALRRGDASAAAVLAGILANQKQNFHPLDPRMLLELAAEGGPAWISALEQEWKKRPDWPQGTLALAEFGVPEALAALQEKARAFTGQDERPRALRLIALQGDLRAFDELMVSGDSVWRPEDAARFWGRLDAPARAAVLQRSANPKDPARETSLRLIAQLALPEGAEGYLEVVKDPQRWRLETLESSLDALCGLGRKDCLDDLRRLLQDEDPAIVAAAIEAVAELGGRPALPELARFLEDDRALFEVRRHRRDHDPRPRRRVWHAALEAFEKQSGASTNARSVVERRDFWRNWNEQHR